MTLVHYTAEVRPGLLLALPAEAEALHLKPGDKLEVQFDTEQEQTSKPTPVLDDKAKAAIAYLEARLAKGANATAEQSHQIEVEFAEIQHNLNSNRAATGERLVSP